MTFEDLSRDIEALLVRRNLRSMLPLQQALEPGYVLRAARHMVKARCAIVGTGFPVERTFETDGPPGAIALYHALEALGCEVHLACANPLATALQDDFRVLRLEAFDLPAGRREAQQNLELLKPDVVISVERPGLCADGCYYNMRGEDISPRCAVFDYYLDLASCPSIGIGDGGNEIGMGKLTDIVAQLEIRGAATTCDELLVADVSNWGAYGLASMLEAISGKDLLGGFAHGECLAYLSRRGSVDGVTRENTETEDGLPCSAGETLLAQLGELKSRYQRSRLITQVTGEKKR